MTLDRGQRRLFLKLKIALLIRCGPVETHCRDVKAGKLKQFLVILGNWGTIRWITKRWTTARWIIKRYLGVQRNSVRFLYTLFCIIYCRLSLLRIRKRRICDQESKSNSNCDPLDYSNLNRKLESTHIAAAFKRASRHRMGRAQSLSLFFKA